MFAKKSLGQNFLRSKKVVADIVAAGKIVPEDIVLEAGPGEGVLTEALLQAGAKVIAVEKDDRLIPILEQKFSAEISSGALHLIHADILNFSPDFHKLKTNNYKLIANIPYYITGMFIRKFLEIENQPSLMVLLLQKEVAQRIVSGGSNPTSPLKNSGFRGASPTSPRLRGAKESILSISVKVYGEPKIVSIVKAGNFSPAPKVDSAILAIYDISQKFFADLSEEKFFSILKTGFAHKRKKLLGNLKPAYPQIETLMEHLGIDKNARAENLSLEMWHNLATAIATERSQALM